VRNRVVGILLLGLACVSMPFRASASALPDLSGLWVLVEVMPALIDLPLIGRIELATVVGLLVDIEQQGRGLLLRRTYCFQDVRATPPLVTTIIPDRFIAALPPDSVTAWLEETAGGWRFVQDACVEIRGARLADPEREALPTHALDPRVFDQDRDGQPGLTIRVLVAGLLGGDLYIVNRTCARLDGWVLEDSSVAGAVIWSSEQNVIGACDPLLRSSFEYVLHPDSSRHFFLLRRIDEPDPCRVIRDSLERLLGSAPG